MSVLHTGKLLLAALALTALTSLADAADEAKPAAGQKIDVVICLDISNSMDGLIGSAKAKLWDIVNDLAKVKPTPDLRVGLYSYGNPRYDAKAGWVRKELDLTTDLDSLYQKLTDLKTHGGDEYVTRVCRDAVEQQKWATEKNALKIIFVCGNEPADQDKLVTLKEAADKAIKAGIIINPIFCGPVNHGDARTWKELATLAGGRFASIDQDRGAVAIATPQDKELAELSTKLNTTYLAYGKEGKEKAQLQQQQDQRAVEQNAAAPRAASKAGGLYRNSGWDLVDRLKEDPKFDIKKVPAAELCEEMKKMSPEEREKHVKEMLAKREAIQKQIAEVSKQRDAYLRVETKKQGSKADKAFDEALRGALREQAAPKGIVIPDVDK